jgi:hypothetical protein
MRVTGGQPSALRRVQCLHAQLASQQSVVPNPVSAQVETHDAQLFPSPVEAMARERAGTSFDVRKMTYLLEGEEGTKLLELAAQLIERDPILHDSQSPHDLTVPEHRERSSSHHLVLLRLYRHPLFI